MINRLQILDKLLTKNRIFNRLRLNCFSASQIYDDRHRDRHDYRK